METKFQFRNNLPTEQDLINDPIANEVHHCIDNAESLKGGYYQRLGDEAMQKHRYEDATYYLHQSYYHFGWMRPLTLYYLAKAFFELKEYEKCVESCEEFNRIYSSPLVDALRFNATAIIEERKTQIKELKRLEKLKAIFGDCASADNEINANVSLEEQYGRAWMMIVRETYKIQGLSIMAKLDAAGYAEASLVLQAFLDEPELKAEFAKRAADAGKAEGMWQYYNIALHAALDTQDKDDAALAELCLAAAEGGCVDAMNEMGKVFSRKKQYAEAMYWVAMAYYCGCPDVESKMIRVSAAWKKVGMPREYIGSAKFDENRNKCAVWCLEKYAEEKQTVTMDDLIRLNMAGVPLAAYLAGEAFEKQNDMVMAYKMYNMISFVDDPHGLKRYADMLYEGIGVEKDVPNAIRFYQLAAEKGDRDAMFIMGKLLSASDKIMAAYWFGMSYVRGNQKIARPRLIQLAASSGQ